MKKQLFSWIVGLIFIVSCSFGLLACDQNQTVDSIEIITPASTLVYEEGEEFSCDGLVIKLKYTDGKYSEEIELTNLTISNPDMESTGTKTINISYTYEGKTHTTTYTITVNEHVHLFNLEKASATYLKSEADCTHKAVYYKSCKCGEIGADTFEPGQALGHDIVEHPAVAATCAKEGNVRYWACSRCNTCYSDSTGETETSFEKLVEKKLNHSFDCVEDINNNKCSVCNEDVTVLGYNTSSVDDPTDYELSYTVLANDGCIDTYHEKYEITPIGTLQSNKSATIHTDTTINKDYIAFDEIAEHPNGIKFFIYIENDILKLYSKPETGGIAQSIVDKIIDPRQVLYEGGALHRTYYTLLREENILPIEYNPTTGVFNAFTIKITQFSANYIETSDTTVKASLQSINYTLLSFAKTARNEHKPNTWSYNKEAYYYTFCNYTDISYRTDNFMQSFDNETGILTTEEDDGNVVNMQLYADLTFEIIEDTETFQPSKEIFTGDPWDKPFTRETDIKVFENIFSTTKIISISYNLEKTYYDYTLNEFDCPEHIMEKISELVGNKTYTKGEGDGEFEEAFIFDEDSNNFIDIESISITKLNDTFSMTYKKANENPITLIGTLSFGQDGSPSYDYSKITLKDMTNLYIFFADFCFETEDEQFVYITLRWVDNPFTHELTPDCIIIFTL